MKKDFGDLTEGEVRELVFYFFEVNGVGVGQIFVLQKCVDAEGDVFANCVIELLINVAFDAAFDGEKLGEDVGNGAGLLKHFGDAECLPSNDTDVFDEFFVCLRLDGLTHRGV